MKVKFKGVICVACGHSPKTEIKWQQNHDSWIGHTRVFRCLKCNTDHILLFDERRAFKSMYSEPAWENFIVSSRKADWIPF